MNGFCDNGFFAVEYCCAAGWTDFDCPTCGVGTNVCRCTEFDLTYALLADHGVAGFATVVAGLVDLNGIELNPDGGCGTKRLALFGCNLVWLEFTACDWNAL